MPTGWGFGRLCPPPNGLGPNTGSGFPPHQELYSFASAAEMDAPTSLCDFASSAAARPAATLRMPRTPVASAASLLAA